MSSRIAVIGAGAMGGMLAALLDRAGHDVEVMARGAHLEAIREHGLHLDGGWGEHLARVAAGPHLTREPELAVLATKAGDAVSALAAELDALGGAPVVVVQNGLDGLRTARAAAPRTALVGALALMASSYLAPGRITVTATAPVILGADPRDPDPSALDLAATVLARALPTEVVDDLLGAQWSKLLVNHVNALPALTGLSVQETVADPALRRIVAASLHETALLARAAGQRFAVVPALASQGVDAEMIRLLGTSPDAAEALPLRLAAGMGSVPNPGSTLQSIRRGQPTEIDALNGAVARIAREHGRRAPIHEAITALVHEVERTGRFLSRDETVRRIPLV